MVLTGPIKGTATSVEALLPKDVDENVMIVDLARHDLHAVCDPGSVEVVDLLRPEHHPGLVHLVSRVRGRLRAGTSWRGLLEATLPPASVTGAPKSTALQAIADLEPVPRGPYCGAVGWVDADRGTAEPGGRHPLVLDVGRRRRPPAALRHGRRHHLGLGPGGEWDETEPEGATAGVAGLCDTAAVTTIVTWVDGRLVAPGDAAVRADDHGVTVGDGVFETLKVVQGRPFALTRHLARLARSAHGLGITAPDDALVRDGIDAVLGAGDPLPFGRLRITVTSGPGPLGSGRGDTPPTVVVHAQEAALPQATAAVHVVPWRRNERSAVAGLKTTSYAENAVALARAAEQGASEALLLNTRDEPVRGHRVERRARARRGGPHAGPRLGLPRRHHPRACCSSGRPRRVRTPCRRRC
ncbi:hypothetical protein GCM10025868_04690 [Angustibacter aerolatus]|uniref:Chorismate-utilising enzyme C-terminal domain-containing protein n=1 Tax=Angustibacter aerolatus TaxID=1162965 RepID=A0ABQ6JDH4_9ACTN|nr:chorismate-binding protein [Angustibacter aerolatus]GMA85219.1 hypothetical protein GCM10025868_04690 [Angustibacter aerolatus]